MMTTPQAQHLGERDGMGRDLYLLCIDSAQELVHITLPTKHFVCFIAWDSADASVDDISLVADVVLKAGAVYVCAWGAGCERVHDIFDETIVGDGLTDSYGPIMTTWHSDETLAEALWFALFCSSPFEPFEDQCPATLVVVVRGDDYEATVRRALSDVQAFSDEVTAGTQPE